MITIQPVPLKGSITIQPSKSYLHRMMICAALSKREVRIERVNGSDDILATLNGLSALGLCRYRLEEDAVTLSPGDGQVSAVIDCKESGSTLRFLLPLALQSGVPVTFQGKGRLMQRPLAVYEALCRSKGYLYQKADNRLTVEGRITCGAYTMPGNLSSQFVTGLLLALSRQEGTSKIRLTGKVESQPYLDLTLDVLSWFGVDCRMAANEITITGGYHQYPAQLTTPGDWSHAAFYAVAGVLGAGVTLRGMDAGSIQGDRAILDYLSRMGADIRMTGSDIVLFPSELSGINVDIRDTPDLAPVLAVAMAAAQGESRMDGAGRLRLKECDRFSAILENVVALGGQAAEEGDSIIIQGQKALAGGRVKTFHDHRMAMSMAVASCRCVHPVVLDDEQCVEKSAPDFWKEFAQLGGQYVCGG